MRAPLKVRLNGREIRVDKKAEKIRHAVPGAKKRDEEESSSQHSLLIKGLATGESIHWVLIE